MQIKTFSLSLIMILVLLCPFLSYAEDVHYRTLADMYEKAVIAENESTSDETALQYYSDLVYYYINIMDQQNQEYSNSEYYYYYAHGRLLFSQGNYIGALEDFEDHLKNAGQTDSEWMNLSFYCDFCEAVYWLENNDVESALPLFVQAKTENPNAAKQCGRMIDKCKELLVNAIEASCEQQNFEQSLIYCELIEQYISKVAANELKKKIHSYQENSNIRWGNNIIASKEITLSWTGGISPYTIMWSADLRESATMNISSEINAQSTTLQNLLPGTEYQIFLKDSAGTTSKKIYISTEPTQQYVLEGNSIECRNISLRSYRVTSYDYIRIKQPATNLFSMQRNYPNYVERIEGDLVINRASVLDGTLGYYAIIDTNIAKNLHLLENQIVTQILHFDGIGTICVDAGRIGDKDNNIEDYMIAISIQHALAEGIRFFSQTDEDISWHLDLLIDGYYIASIQGK